MTAFHPTTNGIPPIRQPATENFAIGFFLANCAVDALRTAQDVRVLSRVFVRGVPPRDWLRRRHGRNPRPTRPDAASPGSHPENFFLATCRLRTRPFVER